MKQRHPKPPTTATLAAQTPNPHTINTSTSPSPQPQLTALQQHILFWDRDNDGIIYPLDVYTGFRALGFSIPFSIGSFLIPIFFSYATTLPYSYIPDPRLRIHIASIHKAKHGSDTGVFDIDGHFDARRFDDMFDRYDTERTGGLSADEFWVMWKRNRCAADFAGWSFAFMELWTTWLLLQRRGRVWREDLKGCYDGTLFWRISEMRERRRKGGGGGEVDGEIETEAEVEVEAGYGVGEFVRGMWKGRTWRVWEVEMKMSD
jgi:Ca2+-binding EF-hand superfamily protein